MLRFIRRLWLSNKGIPHKMQIRVAPPAPGASMSFAVGKPDKYGAVMVDQRMLEHALAHGWRVEHEPPDEAPGANDAATPESGADKRGGKQARRS
jgi:hypothetical protein